MGLIVSSIFSLLLLANLAQAFVATDQSGSATLEDISIMNSQPEVYVKDLKLDKTDYKAGEIVRGSFTLLNTKNVSVSNLNYRVFLVGDLMDNTLYKYEFDNRVLGTIFLYEKEEKRINFEYKLPLSSSAYTLEKQLGVKIRAFSGSGAPLGWTDAKVNIKDSGIAPVLVSKSSIIIDGKSFGLNEGPMVYKDGKVSLNITVGNDTNKEVVGLLPKVSIYEMDYSKSPLRTYSEKEFALNANSKLNLSFDLPTFEYTPKVYVGKMVIEDKNGISRSNPIQFRYIVYGEVVNIQNVSVDKIPANSGDEVNVKINYSGTPYDITKFTSASSTPSDFLIKLFNEKGALVSEYSDKTSFAVMGEKSLKLILNDDSNNLAVQIIITKDDRLITEYKTDLLGKKDENSQVISGLTFSKKLLNLGIMILGLAIITLALYLLRKKKNLLVLLVIMIASTGLIATRADAWTVFGLLRAWDYISYPSITLTSPNPSVSNTYLPGQTFNLTGTAYVTVCNNSDYKIRVLAGGITNTFTNPQPTILQQWSYNPSWPVIKETSWSYNSCGNEDGHSWCGSSADFSSGPYTAPSAPGVYRIYVMAETYFNDGGGYTSATRVAYVVGYQEFTVVPLSAPILTANTSTNCGGKINLSWNNTGANSYKIFRKVESSNNWNFLLSTASTSYELAASSSDLFIIKSTFGSTDSASSTPAVSATPSLPCLPLSVSCNATPATAMVGQNVTWRAVPVGGPSSVYTYLWTGTDGLTGNTASVNKSYSAIGTKHATTTVTSGTGVEAETVIVGCPGSVANGGGGGGGGGGVDITPQVPIAGICGAAHGSVFNNGTELANSNLCYFIGSNSNPVTFSAYGPWTWTCSGVYGSTVSSPTCMAYQTEISNSAYDCSTITANPDNPVNVNNNIEWTATPNIAGNYITKWAFTDSNNPNTQFITGPNPWNKIFTTVGLKTVYVKFASSTAPNIVGNTCTSTINMVQTGGNTREI